MKNFPLSWNPEYSKQLEYQWIPVDISDVDVPGVFPITILQPMMF